MVVRGAVGEAGAPPALSCEQMTAKRLLAGLAASAALPLPAAKSCTSSAIAAAAAIAPCRKARSVGARSSVRPRP